MRLQTTAFALAFALAGAAPAAIALPCAGFTDVQDSDTFCPAVEWLKNRAVTLGCTATGYCPQLDVTRAQMALFMSRLGKALTPVVLYAEQPYGNLTVAANNGETMLCITSPYTPDFARTARLAGQFFAQPAGGPAWLQGRFKFTTNDGGTWQFVGGNGAMMGRDWADTAHVAGSAVFALPMDLLPGTTYRFGLGVDGMGVSYSFNPVVCQVQVTIDNANPAASPFDH
jgi:hypothetical protein